MTFYGNLDYLANEIRNNEKRELTLELALKCKNEIEKINFFENNCFTGDFGDGEDDTWRANLYEFFEENEINDEDGSWASWFDTEHHPSTSLRNKLNSSTKESDPEIFKAYEEGQKWSQSMMVAFENEYPNATELIKNYKLFQFSSWFEEPDNFYKLFTEL